MNVSAVVARVGACQAKQIDRGMQMVSRRCRHRTNGFKVSTMDCVQMGISLQLVVTELL
jgi:hypothetical protein